MLLRSVAGRGALRCVSPVGFLPPDDDFDPAEIEAAVDGRNARVGRAYSEKQQAYDLTVEGDVLLGEPESDLPRVRGLVLDVVRAADDIERRLLDQDSSLDALSADLDDEGRHAR